MSIIANYIGGGVAVGGGNFLELPYKDHIDYANKVQQAFKVAEVDGDSDHFITMENKVTHIAGIYKAAPMAATINNTIVPELKKKSGGYLRSWLSALICCIMYGCDDQTDVHIEGEPFKDGMGNSIQGTRFLEIWKKKFERNGGSNNNDGTVRANALGLPVPGLSSTSFNYITMDPTNPALPKLGYHNNVGTFHDQLFVIPMKEYKLSGVPGAVPEWKKKYLYLCEGRDNPNTQIKLSDVWEKYTDRLNELNVKQKIFLHMSADSISTTEPAPLQLAAALIKELIKLPNGVVLPAGSVTPWKTINGISFYKISGYRDLDAMINDTLYLGRHDEKFYSTYPLSAIGVQFVKDGGKINDVKLKVKTDFADTALVTSAELDFTVNTSLQFINNAGVPKYDHTINYTKTKTYSADKGEIQWIRAIPTICMYPNLTSDLEHRCNKFTYFSRKGTNILLDQVKGLGTAVVLQDGLLMGSLNGDTTLKKLIDFAPSALAPYKNVKAYDKIDISSTEATLPEHFIMISDRNGVRSYGYVLNLRTRGKGDLPALLADKGMGVDIGIDNDRPAGTHKLRAYIDFGSSSSYIRYEVDTTLGNGYRGSLVENKCTLRRCLVDYAKNAYSILVNDPEINTDHKFLSTTSLYDKQAPVADSMPYKDAWTPFVKSYANYGGIGNTFTSHKTELVTGGGAFVHPKIVIHNMLYTIACNAIDNNCSEVTIVPSLPSKDYEPNLQTTWSQAKNAVSQVFSGLTYDFYLDHRNNHFLYESIGVTLGTNGLAQNALNINIDMGDGTTDMSAVYVDAGGTIHFCGYSSIEYAGKDLIKTVVKDILAQGSDMADKHLIGSLDPQCAYGQPIFVPKGNNTTLYKGYINDLKANQNDNDYFESKVMDILDVASFGAGVGVKDQKVAADFILRYMFMMPVIKDFINTAIKIAGSIYNPGASINIKFQGGASKGIDLFNNLDSRNTNVRTLLDRYFNNAFPGAVSVSVSQDNDKQTLIDGLARIDKNQNNGVFELSINGVTVAPVNWDDEVNPKYTEAFGTTASVHTDALQRNKSFVYTGNSNADKQANDQIIHNVVSYYDNVGNPFEDISAFYKKEIYDQLINNDDGVQDPIEVLTESFLSNASQNMQNAINRELLGFPNNSFVKATNSCIYPEMMQSAIFMFTLSKMLSQYQGSYNPTSRIINNGTANGHEFGG